MINKVPFKVQIDIIRKNTAKYERAILSSHAVVMQS